MTTPEELIGYEVSARTRFRVRVTINDDPAGVPRVAWIRHCLSLEEAQRDYVALRNRTGLGASQFGFGAVFDEADQLVANISYNGRLWAPSWDHPGLGWRPGAEPIAEAPPIPAGQAEVTGQQAVRDLLLRLARLESGEEPIPPAQSDEMLRALAADARRLLDDPRTGLGSAQAAAQSEGVVVWAGGPAPGTFTQGPRSDLGFVAELEDGDVVQGFNARGDVLMEGLKTAQGVSWARVHRAELDRARGVVADAIYETAEFDMVDVIDSGGWEIDGEAWRRALFVEADDPNAPSRRIMCVIAFHPASDEADSLSLDGEDLLIPEHAPDYPRIDPQQTSDTTIDP